MSVGGGHSMARGSTGYRPAASSSARSSASRSRPQQKSSASRQRPTSGNQRPQGQNRQNRQANRPERPERPVRPERPDRPDRGDNINGDIDNGWAGDGLWGVAAGVAVGATTAAIIGNTYYALPSGCYHRDYGGVLYYQCGSAWYSPRYAGNDVSYVVVNPPR